MSVFICSDIHGQYDLFRKMLDGIHFSDSDYLFCLGDVIDRGPESFTTMKALMSLPNAVCLLGNHEMMMWDHLHRNKEYDYWFFGNNGGKKTLREFRGLPEDERKGILDYIGEMYLQIELKTDDRVFLLSHSSFLPDVGDIQWKNVSPEEAYHVTWYSPWRPFECEPFSSYRSDNRIHIIGHLPVQSIEGYIWNGYEDPEKALAYEDLENNIIDIDLGCARLGKNMDKNGEGLCCMNLDAFIAGEDSYTYFKP